MIEITYNGFEDDILKEQGFGYPVNKENRDEFLALLKAQLTH